MFRQRESGGLCVSGCSAAVLGLMFLQHESGGVSATVLGLMFLCMRVVE